MVKLAKRKKNDKTSKNQVTWHTPKLLDGLNCKSKGDDSGKRRSWVHSLARNTLGVKGCVGALGWD
jgi:hypothetical protein